MGFTYYFVAFQYQLAGAFVDTFPAACSEDVYKRQENMRLSAFTSDGEFSTASTLEILLDSRAL